jgi:hypothetical protein
LRNARNKNGIQRVGGSNPLAPTIYNNRLSNDKKL